MAAPSVVRETITAAHRPGATQQEINALGAVFEEVKRFEISAAADLASELSGADKPLEAQLFALQILQHIVYIRWHELADADQSQLANMAMELVKNSGSTGAEWPVRSKAALLLALITKRLGPPLWEHLLPQLLNFACQGPVPAEKVCMVLRLVMEEVVWSNEASSTSQENLDSRRSMLSSIVASLDTVLPFLHASMEGHFGHALHAGQAGDAAAAKAHANTVSAALATLGEFADWAPVSRLGAAHLISDCGFLGGTLEFRIPACAVLRRIAARKILQEESALFHPAMAEAGEAIMRAAESILAPQHAAELGEGGSLHEEGQFVCATMGMWAYSNISTLSAERKHHFLTLSLQFTRHEDRCLVHKALSMWVSLLSSTERSQRGIREECPVPQELAAVLMDIAGEKMQQGLQVAEDDADMPESFDTFEDYRSFQLEYRDLLSRIVKLVGALLPEHSLQAAARRYQNAVQVCSTSGQPIEEQRAQFEAMACFVDSVVFTVSQTYLPGGRRQPGLVVHSDPATVASILDLQQGMFGQLLQLKLADPQLVALLARMLEAFSRLIAFRKELAASAIEKVFELLDGLAMEGGACQVPAQPSIAWKEHLHARLKVCGILVTYAKFASESIRVHVEGLARKTDEYWQQGKLSPGENALLSDMMIASVCSAEPSFQGMVLEHVLRSTKQQWCSEAWRQTLSDPTAFVAHFCPVGGGLQRWLLHMQLQILERAAKRLPASANSESENCGVPGTPSYHVFNPDLPWILHTLLQLIHDIHALSSTLGRSLLKEAGVALDMGPRERAVYLRQLMDCKRAGDKDVREEEEATLAGNNVASLRSFIRQVREVLYLVVGWMMRNIGGFFSSGFQEQFVVALTANLADLHSSHVRMLIRHILLPLMRSCPYKYREQWILPVLVRFLPHVHECLTTGWSAILKDSGRSGLLAAQQGLKTLEDASAANEEIVQERLLRELTGEHLILLRFMQGNPDEAAQGNGEKQASVLALAWQACPQAAMAACMTAVASLWWPDENVARACAFLRGVVEIVGRPGLEQGAGRDIVGGALQALSNGAGQLHAEVLGVVRDVLIMRPPLPGPREVLLSLPKVDDKAMAELDAALYASSSEKSQRGAIKTFLMHSGSEELQMALSDWRPQPHLANMSEPKPRNPKHPNADEAGGVMGLAAATNGP